MSRKFCSSNRSLVTEQLKQVSGDRTSSSVFTSAHRVQRAVLCKCFHLPQYRLSSLISDAFNGLIQDSIKAHHCAESYSLLSSFCSIIFAYLSEVTLVFISSFTLRALVRLISHPDFSDFQGHCFPGSK